jgi:hypothetical protein
MTYRTYNLINLVLLRLAGVSIIGLGVELRRLGEGTAIFVPVIAWGIAVLVISLAVIGVTVTRTSELECPSCAGKTKVMVKVKLGWNAGHLYLSCEK